MKRDSFYKIFNKFVIKSNLFQTIVVALISGLYVYSKVVGYVKAYPNSAQRIELAKSISHSAGINFLVGPAKNISTLTGYMSWSSFLFVTLISIIWITILVNRIYRGNEQNDRFDIIFSSKATLKNLFNNIYKSIFGLITIYVAIFTSIVLIVCKTKGVDIPIQNGLKFGLSIFITLIMFSSLALLSSQVFNSSRKANIAANLTVLSFLIIKAIGDLTTHTNALLFSPLGWIEKFDPLMDGNFIYVLLMIVFTFFMFVISLAIINNREPHSSLISYEAKIKSRPNSLSSISKLIIKFNKYPILYWIFAICTLDFFYGLLTKTVVNSLSGTNNYQKILSKLTSNSNNSNGELFTSAIFLISMIMLSSFAVYLVGLARKEEFNGRITNILVNAISPSKYLLKKFMFYSLAIYLAALLLSVVYFIGLNVGGYDQIGLWPLVKSAINISTAALIILSISALIYAVLPKTSQPINYLILIYCIFITILSSDIKLPKILSRIDIFYHIKMTPSIAANWKLDLILVLASIFILYISSLLFSRRDLYLE